MSATQTVTFPPRELSHIEYGHLYTAPCRNAAARPRENTLVIEGEGDIELHAFQRAVDRATDANPAVKLKLRERTHTSSWVDSGCAPTARMVESCEWDGKSASGSDFIYETTLSATAGTVGEFVIAKTSHSATFIIFRSLHAMMDGLGCLHFVRDVFRALNGLDPVGSTVFVSGSELIRRTGAAPHRIDCSRRISRLSDNDDKSCDGDRELWQRLTFKGTSPWLLAKTAAAINEYCHRRSGDTVRIAVPINLRRHLAGKQSTMNYATKTYIDMEEQDNPATFNKKLHAVIAGNREVYAPQQRNRFPVRLPPETITVSDLGHLSRRHFSSDSFTAAHLFGIPLTGSTSCIISALGSASHSALESAVNITIGMPETNGNNNYLEEFVRYMENIAPPPL